MHSSELFMPAIQRALQNATPYLPTQQVDVRLAQLVITLASTARRMQSSDGYRF